MPKAWGGAGAWALEAERAEDEERERAAADAAAAPPKPPPANPLLAGGGSDQSFPSLREAASTKTKKKNKAVAISLSQFQTGAAAGALGGRRETSVGLTPNEMLQLPKGPRERSQDELENGRLGGGFRSYGAGMGGSRGGFPDRRSDDAEGNWTGGGGGAGRRGYGGFDDEPRRGGSARDPEFDQPSRADEAENWGAGKNQQTFDTGRDRDRDRYSSLGGGGGTGGSSSRADDVENWGAGKKSPPRRSSAFGSGYADGRAPTDSDRWARGREPSLPINEERRKLVLDPPKREVVAPSETLRTTLVLDPPKREVVALSQPARTRPSPFGAARPREEVLAEKGVDWKKINDENDVLHSSRPSSAQSSRPGTPGSHIGALDEQAKPRPKVNPFGNAKPREVVLQEKGMDWRKLDQELEHQSINRAETEKEIELKTDIKALKEMASETEGEELDKIKQEIEILERELELLIQELDDKVKFGQKAVGSTRPGSAAGRSDTSSNRPPSQSGVPEENRNFEFVERPQSRGGMLDVWSESSRSRGGSSDMGNRYVDDRRGFRGSKERGFFEGRNMERSTSRERW